MTQHLIEKYSEGSFLKTLSKTLLCTACEVSGMLIHVVEPLLRRFNRHCLWRTPEGDTSRDTLFVLCGVVSTCTVSDGGGAVAPGPAPR